MTNCLRRFSILMLAVAALGLTAQSAQARSELNIGGSMGAAGGKSECPAGQQLVGFSGRTGVWIDRIQIVCATPLAGGHFSQPVAYGPEFGGTGGGRADGFCPVDTMMTGADLNLTTNNRQVATIVMTCVSRVTGENFSPTFGNASYSATCGGGLIVGNCGTVPNTNQNCPGGDVPVGINVRYGQDVNGLGMICGRVAAAAPAPAQVRNYDPAPQPTGPAPLSDYLYIGVWNTVTDVGGHYALTLTPLDPEPMPGAPVMLRFQGSFVNSDGASQYDGTLYGQVLNGSHVLNYTYVQPGSSQQGAGVFILSPDGNALTGNGVANGKDKFAWNGTRKR